MRLAVMGLAIAAAIVSASVANGQGKPDFSGTWTYDLEHSTKTTRGFSMGADRVPHPTEIDHPPSPSLGNDFTAKQDGKTITLDLSVRQQTGSFQTIDGVRRDNNTYAGVVNYSAIYALDGSESRNKAPSLIVGQPEVESVATVAWNGNNLVITIRPVPSTPRPTPPPSTTRTFHLDPGGNLLVDTTTFIAGGPWTYTTAYTRKK